MTQGAEFIADTAIGEATSAVQNSDFAAFAAMTGTNMHYETGSYVDLNGFSFVGGAASKFGDTTLAGFFEYGRANSVQYAGNGHGESEHDYYGIGIAAQRDFGALSVDAALRIGPTSTDFTGYYGAESAYYDTDTFYVTAHAGVEYTLPVTETIDAQVYGRYTVSFLDSDESDTHDIFNSRFETDSVTAHALRAGVRFTGSVKDQLFWKTGAAYEYVFDGEADGSLNGLTIETPAIDGGSGIFEAAVALKPSATSPWSGELAVKGYAGTREGVTGSFILRRSF